MKLPHIPTWSDGELIHVELFTERNSAERHRDGWRKNKEITPRLYPRTVKAGRAGATVWMLVVRKKLAKIEGAA